MDTAIGFHLHKPNELTSATMAMVPGAERTRHVKAASVEYEGHGSADARAMMSGISVFPIGLYSIIFCLPNVRVQARCQALARITLVMFSVPLSALDAQRPAAL